MLHRQKLAAAALILFLVVIFGAGTLRTLDMERAVERDQFAKIPEFSREPRGWESVFSQKLVESTKQPVKLENAGWSEDGNVDVAFYGGNPNCYQFEAQAESVPGAVVVRVYSGQVTVEANRVCTAEARLYLLTVPLPAELRYTNRELRDGNMQAA